MSSRRRSAEAHVDVRLLRADLEAVFGYAVGYEDARHDGS